MSNKVQQIKNKNNVITAIKWLFKKATELGQSFCIIVLVVIKLGKIMIID
jgi:hypothetical protein